MTYSLMHNAPRVFSEQMSKGAPMVLRADHPALSEGRTIHPKRRRDPLNSSTPILKPGSYNIKIGGKVTKGRWRGMPIFTLTLEERATCWTGCPHWRDCYGNKMHLADRFQHGPLLEDRLETELAALQHRYPRGFVLRLHVLGDFYSPEYVRRWHGWLARFPALRIYGYTGWPPASAIGMAVSAVHILNPLRFRVRFSGHETGNLTEFARGRQENGIVCPVQTGDTESCGTCTLCWSLPPEDPVLFIEH